MNERLKTLAESAGFYFDDYNEATQRKVEVLAELIVTECAKCCSDDKDVYRMYERFGVY